MRRLAVVLALAVVLVAGSGLAEAAFTTHESNEQTFTAGAIPRHRPTWSSSQRPTTVARRAARSSTA